MPLDLQTIKDAIVSTLDSFRPIPQPEKRATTPGMIWAQIQEQIYALTMAEENDIWLYDWLIEDDQLMVLFNNKGKLFRADVFLSDSEEATVGEIREVTNIDYSTERATTIVRDAATGRRRWIRVISTAILLRGSRPELDTTTLYDSFLERIARTGEYHAACLYHKGGATRVGQADFLTRDGYCLIDSGVFDDTPLANAVADSLEAHPDFWGTSIVYEPDEEGASRVETVGGVPVEFWLSGTLRFADWLPERQAAALFTTGNHNIRREAMFTDEELAELAKRGLTPAMLSSVIRQTEKANEYAASAGVVARKQHEEEDMKKEGDSEEERAADEEEVYELGPEVVEEVAERAVKLLTERVQAILDDVSQTVQELSDKIDAIQGEREARQREMRPPVKKIRYVLSPQDDEDFTHPSGLRLRDREEADGIEDDGNDYAAHARRQNMKAGDYQPSALAQQLGKTPARRKS